MSLWEIIVASVGIGVHVFVVTGRIGAGQADLRAGKIAWMGAFFAAIQIVMLGAGIALNLLLQHCLSMNAVRASQLIVFALMIIIIMQMMTSAFGQSRYSEHLEASLTYQTCARKAVMASMESVLMGMCVYYLGRGVALVEAAWMIGITTVAAIVGLWFGYRYGMGREQIPLVTGALLLAVIAFQMILG